MRFCCQGDGADKKSLFAFEPRTVQGKISVIKEKIGEKDILQNS